MSMINCPSNCSADPCATNTSDTKNQPLSTAKRLDLLEKEVNALRTDFDKIKWEQAVAEAVIGRAIIRGSVSLGGCYELLCSQATNIQGTKNLMLESGLKDPFYNPNSNLIQKKDQNQNKKPFTGQVEMKKRKDDDDCGKFTLG